MFNSLFMLDTPVSLLVSEKGVCLAPLHLSALSPESLLADSPASSLPPAYPPAHQTPPIPILPRIPPRSPLSPTNAHTGPKLFTHPAPQMRGKKDAARHSLQKYRGVDDVEAELRVKGGVRRERAGHAERLIARAACRTGSAWPAWVPGWPDFCCTLPLLSSRGQLPHPSLRTPPPAPAGH